MRLASGAVNAVEPVVTRLRPARAGLRAARETALNASGAVTHAIRARTSFGPRPDIRTARPDDLATEVESFWGRHTVNTLRLWTPRGSRRQLERRFDQYPLFREFSGLWGEHDDEVILDYGCGPGNDMTGFALYTKARKIIGIDVSAKALSIAADRLAMHRVNPERVELIHAEDTDAEIPLDDASVDYWQSQGVIHHASHPEALLRELHRVLRPGGRACVMVYNRDSVWFNLYVAYELMIRDATYADLPVEEAFARSTDADDCPISRSYRGAEFVALCEAAGFEAEYLGGYLSRLELGSIKASLSPAIDEPRLDPRSREFLRSLTFDADGLPVHEGLHAGIGGTYRLSRPA
jgi:SAM-dependent methyltransferase